MTRRIQPHVMPESNILRKPYAGWVWLVLPVVLAISLYALNNLAALSGWLEPPAGYAPLLLPRGMDFAQYETATRAYQSHVPSPNYHAPWLTEPAFFIPFCWVLAKTSSVLRVEFVAAYHLWHFLLYLVAAFSLCWMLRVFSRTRGQMFAAFLVILCVIPVKSMGVLPALIATGGRLAARPGLVDFAWWTSDGFFHGMGGSLLVTLGTAGMLVVFTLLALYLETGKRQYLAGAAVVTFFATFLHPFEFVVTTGAGAAAFFVLRGRYWRQAVKESLWLGLPALLGLAPYLLLTVRYPWLRDAAHQNRWSPPPPHQLLLMLGLPAILALALLVRRPRAPGKSDVLLQAWFLWTLVALYIPWVPHSQHLMDGLHYGTALLLVRVAAQTPLLGAFRRRLPRIAVAGFGTWVLLSVSAYPMFYRQSFADGRRTTPEWLFSSVMPQSDLAAVSWLRVHARSDQLVLVHPDSAFLFATVPMHSFASHYLFSLTYLEQRNLALRFYKGELDPEQARHLLDDYGVRFVVIPRNSPGRAYLAGAVRRAQFGSLDVFEIPGNRMKPYPGGVTGRARLG